MIQVMILISFCFLNFPDAQVECRNFRSELAPIRSAREFYRLADASTPLIVFLGIHDPSHVVPEDSRDTSRFVYLDGSTEGRDFIQGEAGTLPWDPDDLNFSNSEQFCVAYKDDRYGFQDRSCFDEYAFLCRKSCLETIPTKSQPRHFLDHHRFN